MSAVPVPPTSSQRTGVSGRSRQVLSITRSAPSSAGTREEKSLMGRRA